MPIKAKAILFEEDPTGGGNGQSRWLQIHSYTTAALPSAASTNEGSVVYDTTAKQLKVSNGTTWVSTNAVFTDLQDIVDASGNELLEFDSNASAVNYVRLANAATGNQPAISAQGDDTNISLSIAAKGSGNVNVISPLTVGAKSITANLVNDGVEGGIFSARQQSTSPAASDEPGVYQVVGKDDAGNDVTYTRLSGVISDPTDGAETGYWNFQAQNGTGSLVNSARIYNDGSYGIVAAGSGASEGVFQSNGNHDVILRTGNATSGEIKIVDGADGDVELSPNGNGNILAGALIKNTRNIGTPNTNVTAVEYGDGLNHTTELSFSAMAVPGPTAAANEAHGYLLYTFPAGAHIHEVTYMSVALQGGGTVDADTPDVGIGSVIATGAVAVLGGTATFEDYITGQTAGDCAGTATVAMTAATAGYGTGISLNASGDTKTVHLNYADNWAGADTLAATGKVVLKWTKMA